MKESNYKAKEIDVLTDLKAKLSELKQKPNIQNATNQLKLAETYKNLAAFNFRQSNYNESSKLYSNALTIYEKLNDNQGIISCKNAQASVCLAKGELVNAKSKLKDLLVLLEKHPNSSYNHIVLNNMGIVYEKAGSLPKAVLFYHRSLAIKYELGNPLLPAYTLHNLANIYIQVEDYDTALEYNHEALNLIHKGNDLNAQATILNGIAQIYSKKGLLSDSQKMFKQAIKIARNENNFAQIAQAHAGLGHIEYKNNNFNNAQKLLEQALNSFRKLQEQEYVVHCLIGLAKVYQIKSSKDALSLLHEAITICELNGFRSLLAKTYDLSSRLNAKQKNYKKAYEYQKLYHDLYSETHKTNILNQVEVNKLSIELKKSKTKSDKFKKQADKLEHDSMHDHLTGAGNRRHMDRILAKNWQANDTQIHSSYLAMLDIDDFKKINDNLSHAIGDMVLQNVSTIIRENIGEGDTFFRYGGEEFVILINAENANKAQALFNHIRQSIYNFDWSKVSQQLKVTATLGVVSYSEQSLLDEALKIADVRMYQGKNSGKNIVVYC